jgi:prepilin-type N-terminal cleavage/methylation domain-containing protein
MRRDDAGFTLIELMVSAAVLALISVYLTGMLTQQNRAYTVVDSVTETQSNLRAIGTLMDREVRTSSMMTYEGAVACGVDSVTGPDVLYVTDIDAFELVQSADDTFNVALDENGAAITGGPTFTSTLHLSRVTTDDHASYDLDTDGTPDSDFRNGGGVIVIDGAAQGRGTACGIIREVDVGGSTLTVNFEAGAGSLAVGDPTAAHKLMAIPAHRYMVDDENRLMRDDQVLAEDVEDLQVAYFIDANDNLEYDDEEYEGDADEPVYESAGTDHRSVREIRFNVVMRSRRPDPALTNATFQVTENREVVAGTDGFRRRVFTGTARPRNVGHREPKVVN